MPKAQASLELLAILGVALIYILFFSIFASSSVLDIQSQNDLHTAQLSASKLTQAADYVMSQGDGASEVVSVTLPSSVNFSGDATFVGKPPSASSSTPSNEINIKVRGLDASAYSQAALTGSLPSSQGTYALNVTSHGTFVNIGDEPLSADPSRVYLSMQRNQNALSYVVFSSYFPQPVHVDVSALWFNTGPGLSVAPSQFVLYNGTSTVRLNFTSDSYDGGLYEGSLAVSATTLGPTSTQLNFTVPISVRVQDT